MPTKPPIASPVIATNAVYAAGARIGDPTKISHGTPADGWTPGVVDVAEFYNYYVNEFGQWVTNWLAMGSSSADLDAHIIETASDGLADIAALDVGGTSHPSFLAALTIANNTGSGASRAINAVSTTAACIEATNNSGINGTILATNAGVGPAYHAAPFAGGVGVLVVCVIVNADAAQFTGFGTGMGVLAQGGTSGIGVQGIGGSALATVPGVQGIADHDDANGMEGVTKSTANAGAAGMKGLGRNNGDGVHGEADDGYGVIAEVTGTQRAPLRIVPIAAEPASTFAGDVWPDSVTNNLMTEINSQPVAFWATQHGYTRAFGKSTAVSSTTSATFQDKITVTLGAPYEPRIAGGFIEVTASFEFSSSITGSDPFEWRVLDSTDGTAEAIAAQQEHADVASSTGDTKYVTMTDTYALPAVGARSFKLQWRAVGGSGNSRIRRASLSIKGVYPS